MFSEGAVTPGSGNPKWEPQRGHGDSSAEVHQGRNGSRIDELRRDRGSHAWRMWCSAKAASPGSGTQRWEPQRDRDGSRAEPHQGHSGRSTSDHRRDRDAHVWRTVQTLSEGNILFRATTTANLSQWLVLEIQQWPPVPAP